MTLRHLAITSDNTQLLLPILGGKQAPEASVNTGQQRQVNVVACPLTPEVAAYISASLADNTRKAYRQDLEDFQHWGGSLPCTPEILAAYIADQAHSLSPYTITRRVVGISRAHVSQGFSDPAKTDLVRTVLRGIRKKHGKPQRQVAPLLKQDLLSILPLMQGTKGIRDRAMILLGFAAALRRSELVALDTQDLQFVKEGLVIHLRRSKTDQHGQGRNIAVPYGRTSACPIKAVQIWLEHSCISTGSIFRSVNKGGLVQPERLTTQSVALILKGYAQAAGLNPKEISGHSLRSGLVTSAAQIGVAAHKIQQQTGHRSMEMLHRYIRDANLFENNPAGLLL
jgi:site-specific recombinase XerD